MSAMRKILAATLFSLLVFSGSSLQAASKQHKKPAQTTPSAIQKDVNFAELDKQLAQWKPVQMPFDATGLTERERKMVAKLVEASHYLEDIFLRQSDPEVVNLMQSLAGSTDAKDKKILRMLRIMGSR